MNIYGRNERSGLVAALGIIVAVIVYCGLPVIGATYLLGLWGGR